MYGTFIKTLTAAVIVAATGLAAGSPKAEAASGFANPSSGPSQAVCGKKRCFGISDGRWFIRKK